MDRTTKAQRVTEENRWIDGERDDSMGQMEEEESEEGKRRIEGKKEEKRTGGGEVRKERKEVKYEVKEGKDDVGGSRRKNEVIGRRGVVPT